MTDTQLSDDQPVIADDSQASSDGQHEQQSDEKKEYGKKVQNRISTLSGKLRDKDTQLAERDKTLEANATKLSELEAQISTLSAPKAPNSDMEFDNPDEFVKQTQAFNDHKQTLNNADIEKRIDAGISSRLNAQQEARDLEAKKQVFNKTVETFTKNGEAVGLNENDLANGMEILDQSGLSHEMQDYLLGDSAGPQLVDYLANNPGELGEMLEMSSFKQAAFIENKIRVNAMSTKPTVTGAPDPLLNIQGGGARETEDFDKLCPGAVFS